MTYIVDAMKRRTAILLYRSLFVVQVFALCVGSLNLITQVRSGIYLYLIPSIVGGLVGIAIAFLWFREWKAIETVSEEQWNRAWFIQPFNKS